MADENEDARDFYPNGIPQSEIDQAKADLAAGDHFAGMPGPTAELEALSSRGTMAEIRDEIKAGDAHLMTRNELVEFMQWWVDHPELDANNLIANAMEANAGFLLEDETERLAHEFFQLKGYE